MRASGETRLIAAASAFASFLGAMVLFYIFQPPTSMEWGRQIKTNPVLIQTQMMAPFDQHLDPKGPTTTEPKADRLEHDGRNSAGQTRRPASAQEPKYSTVTLGAHSERHAIAFEFPCNDSLEATTVVASTVSHIRILGDQCQRQKEKAESIEIINEANQFTATIFRKDDQFETDYISLSIGKNPIRLTKDYKDGKREERAHVIERQQP